MPVTFPSPCKCLVLRSIPVSRQCCSWHVELSAGRDACALSTSGLSPWRGCVVIAARLHPAHWRMRGNSRKDPSVKTERKEAIVAEQWLLNQLPTLLVQVGTHCAVEAIVIMTCPSDWFPVCPFSLVSPAFGHNCGCQSKVRSRADESQVLERRLTCDDQM